MSNSCNTVVVGAILGAHGIRGEVRLKSFTEEPAAIGQYGPLTLPDGRSFKVTALRLVKDGLVAKLSGIETRDAAETLKGMELRVPRAGLPDSAGDYYHADLIGLAVHDPAGERVGRVTGVRNYGAGDLIEVERADGSSALIPFTDACVPDVDLGARCMTVDPPEGLLDE